MQDFILQTQNQQQFRWCRSSGWWRGHGDSPCRRCCWLTQVSACLPELLSFPVPESDDEASFSIPHIFRVCSKELVMHCFHKSWQERLQRPSEVPCMEHWPDRLQRIEMKIHERDAQALTPSLSWSMVLSGSQLWECQCFRETDAIQGIWCDVKWLIQRWCRVLCRQRVYKLA